MSSLRSKVEDPSMEQVFDAAKAVQKYFHDNGLPYAFVGGLAVQMWGGTRMTDDVDVSVQPRVLDHDDEDTSTKIRNLRTSIAKHDPQHFDAVNAKPPLVYFTDRSRKSAPIVGCDLLAPGFAGPPLNENTTKRLSHNQLGPTILLDIPFLLYAKLLAWDSRGTSARPEKAATDSLDIKFLVTKMAADTRSMPEALQLWNDPVGRMQRVKEIASRWIQTGEKLGGKDMDTSKSWSIIEVL